MSKRVKTYWLFQICGWSAYCIIYAFFYFTIRTKPQPNFFPVLLVDALTGLTVTHLMRLTMKRVGIMKMALQWQIFYMFVTTVIFSCIYGIVSIVTDKALQFNIESFKKYSFVNNTIRVAFGAFLFLLIWNFIYFFYHYIRRSRREQLDRIRLESLVKEMELNTIKAHINPHFIFNALNSIRALVDENPQRARTAITELSNILRSSMSAEKVTTTTLEKELNIVKDYLALEYIRFEDRLSVKYDIDEDTLDQQIPPMMLQTLVENAIKHGISKEVNGGEIIIISDFKQDVHEIAVRNTGQLISNENSEGFGISSTHNRLKLLFGKQATFTINNMNDKWVEAKLLLPVNII